MANKIGRGAWCVSPFDCRRRRYRRRLTKGLDARKRLMLGLRTVFSSPQSHSRPPASSLCRADPVARVVRLETANPPGALSANGAHLGRMRCMAALHERCQRRAESVPVISRSGATNPGGQGDSVVGSTASTGHPRRSARRGLFDDEGCVRLPSPRPSPSMPRDFPRHPTLEPPMDAARLKRRWSPHHRTLRQLTYCPGEFAQVSFPG
jgi:hypothetical protein